MLLGEFKILASVTDFTVYVIFLVVNISLVVLRFKLPEVERSFRTPWNIGRVPLLPCLGMASIAVMVFSLDQSSLGWGGLTVAIGALLWVTRWLVVRRAPSTPAAGG